MTNTLQSHIEFCLSEVFSKHVTIKSTTAIGGGCINHSMKLECNVGTYFLKWNNQGPTDLFLREAESLQTLRTASTGLIIPAVITATKITKDSAGLIVMELLKVDSTNSIEKDEQLGVGLAQLHQNTNTLFGFNNDNYCGETLQNNQWCENWIEFFGQQRIWYLVKLIQKRRGMTVKDQKVYARFVEALFNIIPQNPTASLTHGDLWSGNYLYTVNGSALIDPACSYADRECDLALMKMFGGFSEVVWSAYNNVSPILGNLQERLEVYQLYHYLNHYYLFGGHYGQKSLSIAVKYL
ncbi:MAG: fructosamine kinase family protein [Tunicatimonas sp.]|uniref:fructosamine kinase family protein n=1 Tax=Tunicatimonas sp. TaxID=1940096 RepID=UPI003C78D2F1